jgi:uncharacterized protein (DUF983 family)
MAMETYTNTPSALPARDWKEAMKRGAKCRCPACGEGRMFSSFLKVAPACSTCGERLDLHRADDMPPYITIMIVGHIVVALNLFFEQSAEWPILWHMVLWPTLTIVMTLLIMQPVKGALIAYQWALRMHGFDPAGDIHAAPAAPRGV